MSRDLSCSRPHSSGSLHAYAVPDHHADRHHAPHSDFYAHVYAFSHTHPNPDINPFPNTHLLSHLYPHPNVDGGAPHS